MQSLSDLVKQHMASSTQATSTQGGLSGLVRGAYPGAKPDITQATTLQDTSPGGNLLGQLKSPLGPVSDIGKGIVKSGASTIQGLVNIGSGIGSFIKQKVFGAKPEVAPQVFSPESLQTQNIYETIGKISGDIAQFFIPAGMEKEAITSLDKMIDTAKLAEKFGPEAAKTIQTILKVVSSGLVTGASTQAVSEAQTGGQAGLGYGLAGFAGGAGAKALEIFGPGFAKAIEKANFKLTPSQETKLASKIEAGSSFIADNKILGSEATKYQKLSTINNQLEEAMQASIGNEVKVSKTQLIDEIKNAPEKFKTEDPAIYQEAKNDAEKAIKTLQETAGDEVGLNDVLSGKRSYGQRAFGKATAQVKGSTVVSEGDYAIEQAYQNTLEKGLSDAKKSIQIPKDLQSYFGGKVEVSPDEFNKVYSQAINAKKFTNAAQFRKDTGLVGRLFGLWAGETTGQVIAPGLPGKIIGGAIGEMAASRVPGIVRNVAQRVVTGGETTIPAAVKTGAGLSIFANQ